MTTVDETTVQRRGRLTVIPGQGGAAGAGAAGAGPRRGLVLGAGGVLGAAWTIGALHALEEVAGFDPRDADVVVGTSAGSVVAGFLGLGVSTEQMVHHQRGVVTPGEPDAEYDYDEQAPLPPRPRFGTLGSRRLLGRTLRQPRRIPPLAALAAVMPAGRASISAVGDLIERVGSGAVDLGLRTQEQVDSWPAAPRTWIVTLDYDSGRRIVFGRPGSPPARLSQAVTASCAIPGWYEPITIGGRRYVDGGTCSATSLDLVSSLGLDEVVVLAPMASFAYDRPRSAVARMERRLRRVTTRQLFHEAAKVRAAGTRVTMLGPGPEDLAAIGANLMDGRRRRTVFETSMRTSAAALRGHAWAGAEAH